MHLLLNGEAQAHLICRLLIECIHITYIDRLLDLILQLLQLLMRLGKTQLLHIEGLHLKLIWLRTQITHRHLPRGRQCDDAPRQFLHIGTLNRYWRRLLPLRCPNDIGFVVNMQPARVRDNGRNQTCSGLWKRLS